MYCSIIIIILLSFYISSSPKHGKYEQTNLSANAIYSRPVHALNPDSPVLQKLYHKETLSQSTVLAPNQGPTSDHATKNTTLSQESWISRPAQSDRPRRCTQDTAELIAWKKKSGRTARGVGGVVILQ
jgi:hypothetical protein